MQVKFKTICEGHAFAYSDGFAVKVSTDSGCMASFPFMSDVHPGAKAWIAALHWARYQRGCRTIDIENISSIRVEWLKLRIKAEFIPSKG